MVKLFLTSAWAHKRRMIGTLFAVLLGVAFLTGTQVLSDTIRSSIDNQYSTANQGVAVVVRNATSVDNRPGAIRTGLISASLSQKIEKVDGVAAVAPSITGFGQMVGSDGKIVSANGPKQAGNWITVPGFCPPPRWPSPCRSVSGSLFWRA